MLASVRARSTSFAGFAISVWLACGSGAAAQPQAFSPALSVVKPGEVFQPLSITGSGFGLQQSGSGMVLVLQADSSALAYWPAHASVALWNDAQIVVNLPPGAAPTQAAVLTIDGSTGWLDVDVYQYDAFSTNTGASQTAGNPIPNEVAVDAAGRAWITEEFHADLKYWDPAAGQVIKAACAECAAPHIQPYNIPHADSPGAYLTIGGTHRTWASADGEDIEVDTLGRVWFIQGGLETLFSPLPNHSRIVSYDPAPGVPEAQRFKIWNVPGDHNESTHLAWDPLSGGIWFTEAPRQLCNESPTGYFHACGPTLHPARLVRFLPDGNAGFLPPDNQFNFDAFADAPNVNCVGFAQNTWPTAPTPGTCTNSGLGKPCYGDHDCVRVNQVCSPTTPWTFACFKTYDVPDVKYIAHLDVDDAGQVWFANYIPIDGTFDIGRLDPQSGSIVRFPVPVTETRTYAQAFYGNGAWDIEVTDAGDVLFTEFFAARIARLDGSLIGNPECQQLVWPDQSDCTSVGDPSCVNPCITHLEIPNPCDLDANGECSTPCALEAGACPAHYGCQLNSAGACVNSFDRSVKALAQHPDGTTWFTQVGPQTSPTTTNTIGIVDATWDHTVLFPPFSLFHGEWAGQFRSFRGSGLFIDPSGGNPPAPEIWFTDMMRRQLGRLRKIS